GLGVSLQSHFDVAPYVERLQQRMHVAGAVVEDGDDCLPVHAAHSCNAAMHSSSSCHGPTDMRKASPILGSATNGRTAMPRVRSCRSSSDAFLTGTSTKLLSLGNGSNPIAMSDSRNRSRFAIASRMWRSTQARSAVSAATAAC